MRTFIWLFSGLVATSLFAWAVPCGSQGSAKPQKDAKSISIGENGPPHVDFSKGKRGVKVDGFTLKGSLAQARVAPNSNVVLHLVLRNTSSTERTVMETRPETDYVLCIESAKGKRVILDKASNAFFRRIARTLKQNEELVADFTVSDSYKFSCTGRYRITAARTIGRLDGRSETQVVSNTVTLTVSKDVEAEPAPKSDK
ncbi:MAG: hypothetical protein NT018_01235 [Armatimonadetes bacterium]|nr:hypothetical protein [Armatimonadota bacterium]